MTAFDRLDDHSRRAFLAASAKTLLGVSLLPLFSGRGFSSDPAATPTVIATPPRRLPARNLIYLYMAGGMSHLDTFDPKPGRDVQGPTTVIGSSADGIQLSGYLPRTAKQMHRCALVRNVSSNQGAHEQGDYFMHTSFTLRGTVRHPSIGAWSDYFGGRGNPTLPGYVTIGAGGRHPGCGFLDAKHAPLPLGKADAGLQHSQNAEGVDAARAQHRQQLLERANADFLQRFDQGQVHAYHDLYAEATKLMGSRDLQAFDLAQEPAELKRQYGDNDFGHGCLLARRLIENDVRVVEVALGGWDTHDDNFDRVEDRATILDRALGALLPDLASRGLLDETLVVVASEFGRTPKINQNDGRDHHPKCFTTLLAGGGVRGGMVHGASDADGHDPVGAATTVPDFNATVGYALGLPLTQVVTSPQGRPFMLADHGRPLTELFT